MSNSSLKISVIIPVYNAAVYVREAVESALAQPETAEVILVEDGSLDDSLNICDQLAQESDKVRLLRHPNGKNRGAGASRNLGICNAKCEIIAFLDADDAYLPGRFSVAARILADQPDIDGVYEVLKMYYENEEAHLEWQQRSPEVYERGLLGPRQALLPEELLAALFEGQGMFFSGNGLTIRKSALFRAGLYPVGRRSEDALMCYRLAAKARLVAGNLESPVALYRAHGGNRGSLLRVSNDLLFMRYRNMAEALWEWTIGNVPVELEQYPFIEFMRWTNALLKNRNRWTRKFALLLILGRKLAAHPGLIKRRYFRRRVLSEIYFYARENTERRVSVESAPTGQTSSATHPEPSQGSTELFQ
jgi:glycosyltransferase involved in cell wall biosynthesis